MARFNDYYERTYVGADYTSDLGAPIGSPEKQRLAAWLREHVPAILRELREGK